MKCLKSIMSFFFRPSVLRWGCFPSLGNSFNSTFSVQSGPVPVLSLTTPPSLLLCLLPVKNGLLWCAEFVSGSVFAPFLLALARHHHYFWLLIWMPPPWQSCFWCSKDSCLHLFLFSIHIFLAMANRTLLLPSHWRKYLCTVTTV